MGQRWAAQARGDKMNIHTGKPMTPKALAARADFEIDVEGYAFADEAFLIGYNGGAAYF